MHINEIFSAADKIASMVGITPTTLSNVTSSLPSSSGLRNKTLLQNIISSVNHTNGSLPSSTDEPKAGDDWMSDFWLNIYVIIAFAGIVWVLGMLLIGRAVKIQWQRKKGKGRDQDTSEAQVRTHPVNVPNDYTHAPSLEQYRQYAQRDNRDWIDMHAFPSTLYRAEPGYPYTRPTTHCAEPMPLSGRTWVPDQLGQIRPYTPLSLAELALYDRPSAAGNVAFSTHRESLTPLPLYSLEHIGAVSAIGRTENAAGDDGVGSTNTAKVQDEK